MIGDILRALGQLGDRRFLGVLALGTGLSIALLFGFTVLFAWVAGALVPDNFSLPWIGEITWLDNAASFAVIPVMIGASIFLMVPVASAFTGLFLDRVVDAVEAVHYPNATPAQLNSWFAVLTDSLRFLGLIVGVNLLALILYLIFAPFAPVIFWAVNGLLLGREYATLVAQRRMSLSDAQAFRRRNVIQIWGLGTLMAIPLTIPVVNLLVPILGVAAFTHLVYRLSPSGQTGHTG